MPRGYLGEYSRTVQSVTDEIEVVEVHIRWCHLSCGHTLRFTGRTDRRAGGRVNCPTCEFEAKAKEIGTPKKVKSA